jgi:toxin CcdB
MPRFDVFTFDSPIVPLVVDVQADLLAQLATRVVVPLVPLASPVHEAILPRLKPEIEIDGRSYLLVATDLTALPRAELGERIANLEARYHQEIVQALDMLFHGF